MHAVPAFQFEIPRGEGQRHKADLLLVGQGLELLEDADGGEGDGELVGGGQVLQEEGVDGDVGAVLHRQLTTRLVILGKLKQGFHDSSRLSPICDQRF